ncbi:MAG: hypothetical protein HY556_07715 [Euryarchaeota archaeon]|nr:hypothetical protein [Euryarchaeota archaeon]
MTEVVSFRPTSEELEIIEIAKKTRGLDNTADAVRFLIRRGAYEPGSLADEPVFRLRAPKRFRGGEGMTSKELDESLYGGKP